MIERSELIKILESALSAEERSIPIYVEHLQSAVFWLGMEPGKIENIKATFRHLAEDSERHCGVVLSLLKRVREGGKDAF